MFGSDPKCKEGCPSCSFLVDHVDGANLHLPHRDVTPMVVSSRSEVPDAEGKKLSDQGNESRNRVDGATPEEKRGRPIPMAVDLEHYSWQSHCNALFALSVAA
jgi:hypothetical protein